MLSGGDCCVVDPAVVRQLPGALVMRNREPGIVLERALDHPHYTRPEVYENDAVPAVLLSGNHAEIGKWRLKQSLGRTWRRRPDLLAKRTLSEAENVLLEEFKKEGS